MDLLGRDVSELLVLGFVIVGIPALLLKLTTIWFLREEDRPRLRLLALSIGGSSLAGAVAILCYAVLSRQLEFPQPSLTYAPRPFVPLAAAATLVGLVAASELALWRGFARRNGPQPTRATAAWLIAGNAWILWAVWLMDQYRTLQQSSAFD